MMSTRLTHLPHLTLSRKLDKMTVLLGLPDTLRRALQAKQDDVRLSGSREAAECI